MSSPMRCASALGLAEPAHRHAPHRRIGRLGKLDLVAARGQQLRRPLRPFDDHGAGLGRLLEAELARLLGASPGDRSRNA